MNWLFFGLLIFFVVVSVVSFVLSAQMDKVQKKNKEIWYSQHTKKECDLIDDYINFVKSHKEKKVKKNEKKNNI